MIIPLWKPHICFLKIIFSSYDDFVSGRFHTMCFLKGNSVESLLKPNDVATILNISVKAVHALCRSGQLNYVRINKKERRFTEEMIEAFVASRTVAREKFDKKRSQRIPCPPKKGGDKSSGVNRAQLREEMRSW